MTVTPNDPRVALVSVGLGRVQRGFERYFSDLFGVLRPQLDVTIYKSGGECGPSERIPPRLGTLTSLARAIPLRSLLLGAEYDADCLAFGLGMLPDLRRERFDIVHCIDPPMAVVLGRLKRLGLLDSRLLFTEGCVMPPRLYPRVDHVHHVAKAHFDGALAHGIPASHMTLVPCGLHADRFVRSARERDELRRRHGISESTFVVVSVSALKREHKRVDYIIDEVSRLEGDVLLWLDGNPEDDEIPELARRKLGSRQRITKVPSAEVPSLYRMADVLVHASLEESFGLSLVEAVCAGLPVLAHDTPHFQWLVQEPAFLLDMSGPGNLTKRLADCMGAKVDSSESAPARAEAMRQRFEWESLVPDYVTMYRSLAAG